MTDLTGLFFYDKDTIDIITESGDYRLDIGGLPFKRNTPTSEVSSTTLFQFKRLDGPNTGPVRDDHIVGIFSADGKYRLDVGTASMKVNVPVSHVSWATSLKLERPARDPGGKVNTIAYYGVGQTFGIVSSTRPYRLDIGPDACNPASASHDSWATRFKIRHQSD
jgi:hypothetical protein